MEMQHVRTLQDPSLVLVTAGILEMELHAMVGSCFAMLCFINVIVGRYEDTQGSCRNIGLCSIEIMFLINLIVYWLLICFMNNHIDLGTLCSSLRV